MLEAKSNVFGRYKHTYSTSHYLVKTLVLIMLIPLFFLYFLFFRETNHDLMTILGAMYSAVLFLGVNNASTIQPIVAIERTVFYRERAAGMYFTLPYAIAQVRLQVFSAKFSKLKVDKKKTKKKKNL